MGVFELLSGSVGKDSLVVIERYTAVDIARLFSPTFHILNKNIDAGSEETCERERERLLSAQTPLRPQNFPAHLNISNRSPLEKHSFCQDEP